MADAACFEKVARILEADPSSRQAVILSACRGVTDDLLGLVDLAERRDAACRERLDAICRRHVDLARELLGSGADPYIDTLKGDCADLQGVLETVALIRQASRNIRDIVAGSGELWSSRLFEGLLFGITPLDLTTYAAVAAAFAAIAVAAAFIPARRASAVDPVAALRAE